MPTKQKAFRSGEITHLFYVTNAGEILLGYIDQQVTILWRVEKGKEIKATAHGDMAERRMWSVPNAEHADLFAREATFWTDKWGEYSRRKLSDECVKELDGAFGNRTSRMLPDFDLKPTRRCVLIAGAASMLQVGTLSAAAAQFDLDEIQRDRIMVQELG